MLLCFADVTFQCIVHSFYVSVFNEFYVSMFSMNHGFRNVILVFLFYALTNINSIFHCFVNGMLQCISNSVIVLFKCYCFFNITRCALIRNQRNDYVTEAFMAFNQ